MESEHAESLRRLIAAEIGIADPQRLGWDDDLRDLGMDSLQAAHLGDAIWDAFGVDPIPDLERPTLGQLADCVDRFISHRKNTGAAADDTGASMSTSQTIRPEVAWQPLTLAVDDLVPNPILLVLGYRDDLTEQLAPALRHGLDRFPHFAGRLRGSVEPFDLQVVPDGSGIELIIDRDSESTIESLPFLSSGQLKDRFIPTLPASDKDGLQRSSLLAVRSTTLSQGGCVLGIAASHLLVDGTGLALFLQRCTESLRYGDDPAASASDFELVHSRAVLDLSATGPSALPPWYTTDPAPALGDREWDLASGYGVTWLKVDDVAVDQCCPGEAADRWFRLTAILCECLREAGGFCEAAFWCDVRGKWSIPRTYTGNVGCYWHEPLKRDNETIAMSADRFRRAVQSDGVAATYRAMKQAEGLGNRAGGSVRPVRPVRPVRWLGTGSQVLPINLVPLSGASVDFGRGEPEFVRLLTRNLHGLRIARATRERSFLVEACLPGDLAARLDSLCRAGGLHSQVLCCET